MINIVLIVPKSAALVALVGPLRKQWNLIDESDSHCVITDAKNHCIVNAVPSLFSHYSTEELEHHRFLAESSFYLVEFSNFAFGKQILRELTFHDFVCVDDDFGRIVDGKTFSRALEDPNFDWRAC